MAWIKTHPHLLVLIVVALAVLAASGFVWKSAQDFDHKFDVVRQPATKGTKVPMLEAKPLEDAAAEFAKPAAWKLPQTGRSLFVSKPLMVENGELKDPGAGSANSDSFTKKPIPNQWFTEHNLPPFKKGVGLLDSDGDGFLNEDEWRAGTDPEIKESHPPYITKLFFVRYIKVPFIFTLKSINGDPKKPETLDFQVNTTATGKGSVFLKLGEILATPKAKFKLDKFESKMVTTASGTEVDVSELTLTNLETGAPIVLVLNKPTDSPESFAHFHFLWPDPWKPKDISVPKTKTFDLPPEPAVKYILLDIDDTKAVIQLPSGEKLEILPVPAGYPPKP
jgi:hypothetical protein